MLGLPGTEVIACDFPKNDKFESPPIPMLIVRRKAKSATFIALYQAERHNLSTPSISASENEIKVTLNSSHQAYNQATWNLAIRPLVEYPG